MAPRKAAPPNTMPNHHNVVIPLASTFLDTAEKWLTSNDKGDKPTEEDSPPGPLDPTKTPRAAIQGPRPRSHSDSPVPSVPFLPAPVVRRNSNLNSILEEEDYDMCDDDEWATAKEDPMYEKARRRRIQGTPENDFLKVGRKALEFMGLKKSPPREDALKLFKNERRGFVPGPHPGSSSIDDWSAAAFKALSTRGRGSRMEDDDVFTSNSTRKTSRGVNLNPTRYGQPSDTVPRRSRPSRRAMVESEDDEDLPTKPMSQLTMAAAQNPKPIISSDLQDNTVSWRRGRTSTSNPNDKVKEDVNPIFKQQNHTTTKRNKESHKGDETHRGRAPTTRHPLFGIDLLPYRERARSLESVGWSTTLGANSEDDEEPRKVVDKTSQNTPRRKDEDEGGKAGWRVPDIDFSQPSQTKKKMGVKRSPENESKKRDEQTQEKRDSDRAVRSPTSMTKKSKSKPAFKKAPCRGIFEARTFHSCHQEDDEFAESKPFDEADQSFFAGDKYDFVRAKLRAEKKRKDEEKAKTKRSEGYWKLE